MTKKWSRDVALGLLIAGTTFLVTVAILQHTPPTSPTGSVERHEKAVNETPSTSGPARPAVLVDHFPREPLETPVRDGPPPDPPALTVKPESNRPFLSLDELAAKTGTPPLDSRQRARIMEAYLRQLSALNPNGEPKPPYLKPEWIARWIDSPDANRGRHRALDYYPLQFRDRPIPKEYLLPLEEMERFLAAGAALTPRARNQALEYYTAQLSYTKK